MSEWVTVMSIGKECTQSKATLIPPKKRATDGLIKTLTKLKRQCCSKRSVTLPLISRLIAQRY